MGLVYIILYIKFCDFLVYLSFIKLSQRILNGNVWRSLWPICMWILALERLKNYYYDELK